MSTGITRHPDAATLMSFAAGGLPEALAVGVSAHVSMCRTCQRELRHMEHIRAALTGASETLTGQEAKFAVPSRPQEPGPSIGRSPAPSPSADKLPTPIGQRYGLTFDSIPWRRLGIGLWHHRLPLSSAVKGDLRLIKLAGGRKIPVHSHTGSELTFVIDGAFADQTGRYRAGDVQDLDEEIEHQPVADESLGCVCLVASEEPPLFTGLVGPFLRLLYIRAGAH